jgi:hypothetical protein
MDYHCHIVGPGLQALALHRLQGTVSLRKKPPTCILTRLGNVAAPATLRRSQGYRITAKSHKHQHSADNRGTKSPRKSHRYVSWCAGLGAAQRLESQGYRITAKSHQHLPRLITCDPGRKLFSIQHYLFDSVI